MWENLTVSGFHFNSSAEYADAKHEAQTIEYIGSRMNLSDPEIALKVYYKLLERQNMKTVVGLSFLKQLRDCVVNAGIIDEEQLKTIHAPEVSYRENSTETGDETALEDANSAEEFASDVDEEIPNDSNDSDNTAGDEIRRLTRDIKTYKEKEKKLKNVADYYRGRIKKMYIIVAGLIVIIGVLFGLAIHNKNLIPYNEEIAIQDKYAAWEEELSAREAELNAREEALNY